ncbi:oligopeptide transporter [Tanacetum coccineum]
MSTSSNTTFEFDVNHNGEFKLNLLTYQDGFVLNIHVFQMDFEDMVSYLKWKIPRAFTTLYYMLPPYYTLSGMKQIKNDYHTNVMYDIAKVAGKLQIFVSHTQIDLSTVLIPNDGSLEESFAAQYKLEIYIDHIGVDFVISKYIFPNASLAEMMNHVITDYSSENEGIIRQETQNDYTFNKMVEWAEQEHFEYEETKVTEHHMAQSGMDLKMAKPLSFKLFDFFSLIDIIPTALDIRYVVELADEKTIGVDTIIRGCTLNLLSHPFNIDLMPIELDSFDVIIGMDWLLKYHAIIVCDEKMVGISFDNEILTIQGDRSNGGSNSRSNITSCTKTQKYIQKECHLFLAQIT